MAVEVGQKVTGKVTGITHFGAFISLADNQSGLVHISEISEGFVKDINEHLSIGDEVEVKVLKVTPDGKINLSIRKAQDGPGQTGRAPEKKFERKFEKKYTPSQKPAHTINPKATFNQSSNQNTSNDFDNLMGQFLKDSEDRLTSLRRNTENKRGGRGGRRG